MRSMHWGKDILSGSIEQETHEKMYEIWTIFFGTKGGGFIKDVFKIWKFSLKKGGGFIKGGVFIKQ